MKEAGSKCLFVRYAVEGKRVTEDQAKPKLFEPTRTGELSTFDVGGLSCKEICELGIPVAKERKKNLHGWGEISCKQIKEAGIEIDRDNDPERHVTIRGWPMTPEDRKLKQLQLARIAYAVKLDFPAKECGDCAQCA